ncbi:MAG: NAD(P)/FAD-dependent oxidoreductase [Acidobacteria bacterium]|nr:NAD(P)/FAD-dependent oxidoreductase [Acidobacteriota bacterium]
MDPTSQKTIDFPVPKEKEAKTGIVVVGGGAAGMTAAIAAARRGADVTVVERMARIGKKLLATGNGRCNLTNTNRGIEKYHGANPEFVLGAFGQFHVGETLSFFEELGVEPVVESDGCVYPASGQASSVLDVLRYEMEHLGVAVLCDTPIRRIEKGRKGFGCMSADGGMIRADRVIVAAGGKSSPNLGSNGSGFKIAEALGHTVKTPFPALVQILLDAPFLKRLAGVRIQGRAECRVDNIVAGSERGELLFADYGISGIPILGLSRPVSENAGTGRKLSLHLDLFPDAAPAQVAERIARRIAFNPGKPLDISFIGMLHKRLIGVILEEAGCRNRELACGSLSPGDIHRIAALLKDWPLQCTGVKSWMFSQVTAGGVDVGEVNPRTMESKIVPGIFFAGEVLDIDGDCGGYNLQWAWSSGYVAGISAAK